MIDLITIINIVKIWIYSNILVGGGGGGGVHTSSSSG